MSSDKTVAKLSQETMKTLSKRENILKKATIATNINKKDEKKKLAEERKVKNYVNKKINNDVDDKIESIGNQIENAVESIKEQIIANNNANVLMFKDQMNEANKSNMLMFKEMLTSLSNKNQDNVNTVEKSSNVKVTSNPMSDNSHRESEANINNKDNETIEDITTSRDSSIAKIDPNNSGAQLDRHPSIKFADISTSDNDDEVKALRKQVIDLKSNILFLDSKFNDMILFVNELSRTKSSKVGLESLQTIVSMIGKNCTLWHADTKKANKQDNSNNEEVSNKDEDQSNDKDKKYSDVATGKASENNIARTLSQRLEEQQTKKKENKYKIIQPKDDDTENDFKFQVKRPLRKQKQVHQELNESTKAKVNENKDAFKSNDNNDGRKSITIEEKKEMIEMVMDTNSRTFGFMMESKSSSQMTIENMIKKNKMDKNLPPQQKQKIATKVLLRDVIENTIEMNEEEWKEMKQNKVTLETRKENKSRRRLYM